ncbi:unnamed protein product [Zymoseptoria tritici ST99CH_3D7]|uniref:Uncharacterized protein n=1 Tax=Zymoseptoria tritici (strain ST99CH_3D7) TaxID=1276538 RepID=A0A1X7RDS3_ZYMT9|nr:unnamed protein product [Zymoseptoria tritici ST99CH_3D7]
MTSLSSLPVELIARIGDFTDPFSHLNLACAMLGCATIDDSADSSQGCCRPILCVPYTHFAVRVFEYIGHRYVMLGACKNELTSLAFHGEEPEDVEDFIREAQETVPNLQSLMFYSLPQSTIDVSGRGFYAPEGAFGSASNEWRVVTVVASDIAQELDERHLKGEKVTRERFTEYFFAGWHGHEGLLPESLEVLVLTGSFRELGKLLNQDPDTSMEEMMDWFDDALVATINARTRDQWACEIKYSKECDEAGNLSMSDENHEPQEDERPPGEVGQWGFSPDYEAEFGPQYVYPALKAIFIEPWDGMLDDLRSSSRLWLQKSIKSGIERGVDIRTRTNVNKPLHQDLQFHVGPDRFDMRPDVSPPENQEFDPILGRWVDRGCQNCGNCNECFALFPRELWSQAYKAPQHQLQMGSSEHDAPEESTPKDEALSRRYDPRTEIWTKIWKVRPGLQGDEGPISPTKLNDEQWMEANKDNLNTHADSGHRVRKVDEYACNRRCAAVEIMGFPDVRVSILRLDFRRLQDRAVKHEVFSAAMWVHFVVILERHGD